MPEHDADLEEREIILASICTRCRARGLDDICKGIGVQIRYNHSCSIYVLSFKSKTCSSLSNFMKGSCWIFVHILLVRIGFLF